MDQLTAAFPACQVWLDVTDLGASRTILIVCPAVGGSTIALDASVQPKLPDEAFLEAIHDHIRDKL